MDALDLVQRSDEWARARCGSLGASQLHEAIAKTKTGWGASRANLRASLVVERLTGVPQETYQNAAMLHGIETEPQARAAYAFYRDAEVAEVGLIRHPRIANSHASPDGLIGADGMLELKCPNSATHIAFLLGDEAMADKYVVQCQWQMACSGRAWVDFCSFDPRMPEDLRLWVKRLARDDRRISELEAMAGEFLAEVDALVARLRPKDLAA